MARPLLRIGVSDEQAHGASDAERSAHWIVASDVKEWPL